MYNTLANVRALVRSDAAAGEAMLNHLIAYLRAAMPDLRVATTTLGQELDRAAAYLEIMRIRLGERLSFSIDCAPSARACAIAPLAVMTLVENAIKHGIESRPQGGTLSIAARRDDRALTIEVIDDGSGFKSESGEGVGLINLQARLCALFGSGAQLSVQPNTPSGVVARIHLPVCIEGDPL